MEATGVDAEFVLSHLRRSPCTKTVLIVDVCHSGAFFNGNRGIPDGLYAITSCGPDEVCGDTPDGGAFTTTLVAALRSAAPDRDGDGLVSIDDLHEFVKERMRAAGQPGTPLKWVWNVREPIYLTQVPKHVFLSYAREDRAAVEKLEKALRAEGLAVWIDRDGIQSGSWKEQVTAGLNRARALVLWTTPSSLASEPVRKELAFAAAKRVPIVPVVPLPLTAGDFPDWFTLDYGELHRHELQPKHFAESARRLAEAIRDAGERARPSPPPESPRPRTR